LNRAFFWAWSQVEVRNNLIPLEPPNKSEKNQFGWLLFSSDNFLDFKYNFFFLFSKKVFNL